jgi:hypothetical protein
MKKRKRDLLVLFRHELMNQKAIQREVGSLNELLHHAERIDNFVSAHELIDINRYKVFKTAFEIKKNIRSKKEHPFVFLNNMN